MKEKFLSIFQIRIIYVLATLILVGLSFFVFRQFKHLISASYWVHHSTEVSLELEKILSSLKEAEAGHRGYLLTKDSSFLLSFQSGLNEYPEHVKNVYTLTADNPAQQKNIREIERLSKDRIDRMRKTLALANTDKFSTRELRVGKSIMDTLRIQIATMNEIENNLLTHRNLAFEKQTFLTPLFILIISLLALGILMLSYYRINSSLLQSHFLQKELQLMVMEAPALICMMRGPQHVYAMANDKFLKLIGNRNIVGKTIREVLPELDRLGYVDLLDIVYATGMPQASNEVLLRIESNNKIPTECYINFIYRPSVNTKGEIEGILIYGLDVTEEVLSRKNTEESETRLRIALEGGELGTFDFNPDNNQLKWSSKTKEFFGLDENAEVSYDTYIKALHPDDREKSRLIVEGVILSQNKNMYELEYRAVGLNDGRTRWLRSKGRASFDEAGRLTSISGIIQDVTQRKLAEEVLKVSEERFRTLVVDLPVAVYSCDAEGRITFFNDAAVALWGRTPAIGKDLWSGAWKIIKPNGDSLPLDQCPMAVALKEGQASFGDEILVERPDGSRATVIVHPQPQFGLSGEITGAINTLIDITPQLDAMKAVKESESRFRLLAETLPQLVWVTNEKGLSEYTSQRWEQYSGIVPGGEKEWKAVVYPEDYDAINNSWINSLTTGTTYKSEVRLKSRKGEYRWHAVYGEPIMNADGQIVKWVGAFTDIHSEKEFSQQLEKEVKERTNEIAVKNLELEKTNKELESFNYISSHDLQEPLRKIQTFISRILAKERENLSDTGLDYFRRIQTAAERMQTLIEDLLAFSRASSNERVFEHVKLNLILADVEFEFKDALIEKKALLTIGQLCEIDIIPFQFRQLMHNLIGNALKFTREEIPPVVTIGSKNISGHQLFTRKDLNLPIGWLDENKTYCMISITDNGIGFESRFKEKIFEVFQRLHSKGEYSGTGIGLAIVKRIVENHKGFIDVESVLNEGTSFKIYLPTKQ